MKKIVNFFENAPLEEITEKLKVYGVGFTENKVDKKNQVLENRIMDFGNPIRRRNRPYIYQIIKTNYNNKNGDIINTYCIQQFNSKTLQYFIEVCPKDNFEYVIRAEDLGKKHLNFKDCRDIVKELLKK